MAVETGNSAEKTGRTLYTGLVNVQVVAINPTKAEMEKLGYQPQKDPVYTVEIGTDEKKQYTKIALYVTGEGSYKDNEGVVKKGNVKSKIEYLISARQRVSQNGNIQFIDKFGNSAYGSTKGTENMGWFWGKDGKDLVTNNKIREAYEGEADLIAAIKAWMAVDFGRECTIDNWTNLVNGNLNELTSLMKAQPNNKLKVLAITSTDEKYQNIYNRMFGFENDIDTKKWVKHFNSNTGSTANYQNDFTFKPFIAKADAPDAPDNGANDAFKDELEF